MESPFSNASSGQAPVLPRLPLRRREEEDPEGWLVSYADLITLLFIFFSLMLSISVVSKSKFEMMSNQFNHASTTSLMELQKHLEKEIQRQDLSRQVSTQISDEGLQIQFNEGVLFGSAEAVLNPSGQQVLARFARMLAGVEQSFRIAIEGHTDNRPIHTVQFPSNWSLSAVRSVNVLHFMAANGVDEKRMMVRAYADTRPVKADGAVPDAGQEVSDPNVKDRRVTLLVY